MRPSTTMPDSTIPKITISKSYQDTPTISSTTQWRMFITALVFTDIFMTVLAFFIAYIVRFKISLPIFQLEVTPSPTFYLQLVILLTSIWGVIFIAIGLYSRENLLGGTKEYALLFHATTYGLLIIIIAGYLVRFLQIARGWLLLAWVFSFIFAATGRFILRRVVYNLRHHGYFMQNAIIIGSNEEGVSLAQQLISWKTSGFNVKGFIDDMGSPGDSVFGQLNNLGTLGDLDVVIEEYGVDELVLATSALTRIQILDLFKRYGITEKVKLTLSSGLFEIITTGLSIEETAYVPLIVVNRVRLTGIDKVLKSILDYTLVIPGIVLISPVLLIISLILKLDSKGSIIHRRRVLGVNGREFDAFKFRTMFENSDDVFIKYPKLQAEFERNHKLKSDPRITWIGHYLRKYSFDELPQLFNVLRGEMSLVGPRMISPEELPKYNQWGINLLTVKPGITGLWQVSGRSDIQYEERVRLDMQYIRNWTIWLDLQLLLRTIPTVLRKQGAY